MNILPKIFRISLIALLLLSIQNNSFAATTGWINYKDAKRLFSKLRKNKELLKTVKCKSNSGHRPWVDAVLFKFSYSTPAGAIRWRFAWGSTANYKRALNKGTKNGLRIVSHNQFIRPQTGLKVQCAVMLKFK